MIVAAINWQQILLALIAAIPATAAALVGYGNRRQLRTPSGDAIGHVVERTHDLAAVVTAATIGTTPNASLARSVDRINGDPESPVTVTEANGDTVEPPSAKS